MSDALRERLRASPGAACLLGRGSRGGASATDPGTVPDARRDALLTGPGNAAASADRIGVAPAGGFALAREPGCGGMATVHLAHDRKHERRVAIEVPHADLAAAPGPERFLQEIRLAAPVTTVPP